MVMRAMGAWMRKKKKRETMTVTCKKWSQTGEKGIESWEVGLGVCVCACCCVLQHTEAQRGGLREAKKYIIYREIYKFKVHNHNKHAG